MAIVQGWMLPKHHRLDMYLKLRRALPEDLWSINLQGHRVLVAQDKASEMARGLIHKPKNTVELEQQSSGSGWIIGVGPCVGKPGAPHPVGLLCDEPEDLLGLHVYYGIHTGRDFRTDEEEDEFGTRSKTHLVVMTDRDIQAVDEGGPVPKDLTDGEKLAITKAAIEQGLLEQGHMVLDFESGR